MSLTQAWVSCQFFASAINQFMGFLDELDELDLFLLKYGLIIANFVTIFFLLLMRRPLPGPPEVREVLLVTAHPDDEAMFFIPTIRYLRANNYRVHLLCLSNGNAAGLGKVREAELEKCARFLGVEKVKIVDEEGLPDSMTKEWASGRVREIVEEYVAGNAIKGVVTFDERGVSGHTNHRACYRGVLEVKDVRRLVLESTNLVRKYMSILDFFVSAVRSEQVLVNWNIWVVWKAMALHRSQFVWYRKLFVVFSRYGYINTLREIK